MARWPRGRSAVPPVDRSRPRPRGPPRARLAPETAAPKTPRSARGERPGLGPGCRPLWPFGSCGCVRLVGRAGVLRCGHTKEGRIRVLERLNQALDHLEGRLDGELDLAEV